MNNWKGVATTVKNPGKKLQGVKIVFLEVWQRAVVFAVEKLKILNLKTINVIILLSGKTAPSWPKPFCIREDSKTRNVFRFQHITRECKKD